MASGLYNIPNDISEANDLALRLARHQGPGGSKAAASIVAPGEWDVASVMPIALVIGVIGGAYGLGGGAFMAPVLTVISDTVVPTRGSPAATSASPPLKLKPSTPTGPPVCPANHREDSPITCTDPRST